MTLTTERATTMTEPTRAETTPTASGVPALQLTNVAKSFKQREGRRKAEVKTALLPVNLTVNRGEVVGILGPNGSGKSTLIRIISTLLLPDSGDVRVFGVDALKETRSVQRFINRVSVEASFFKKLSATENLLYGATLYGLTNAEARPRIETVLRNIGFDLKRVNEPMENLSRGMQQKIALARALLTSPMLMLLDEPTTGLDPRSKREVQLFIEEIHATHDSSILICTHDMAEAEELCDRIGIMKDGQIVALDTPEGLKRQYQRGDSLPTLEEVFFIATGTNLKDEGDPEDSSSW